MEYIEINGANHPIIVNFFVIGEFQRETGETLSSLTDVENKLYLIEPLLWHSLRYGYIISKQQIPFERTEMPSLLLDNNIYIKFMEVITKFFPTVNGENTSKKKKI